MTSSAVVTPHRLSAEAGRDILLSGGNAIDAAIAAIAAQGVVAPETCGVGGDMFAIVHRSGWERPRVVNASGRAGSKVDTEKLRSADAGAISETDPESVTVPGCVDGIALLNAELGDLDLAAVLEPAIELAKGGFPVSTEQARAFSIEADTYRRNPAVSDFYPEGRPVESGDMITRSDLAETLAAVAEGGRDAFYLGIPGADITEATSGLITPDDLARNQAEWIDTIGVDVFGLTAWTVPPNSQGYLGPATLAVFEMLDPPDDPENPLWWHLLIESYRCLAWERDDLVSDPGHIALPADLLMDEDRLERAAQSVDVERAGTWPDRIGATAGTAYLAVVDATGTAVSMIQSNYRGTGSAFGARRSGFLLQDRGSGFNLMPGHPNELAPGKRPLHTLAPTLWTEGGETRWVLGTRGGSFQPQLVAQLGARAIRGGSELATAQASPRWTVSEFGPGSGSRLAIEPGVDPAIHDDLGRRGHMIESLDAPQPGWGPMSIVHATGEEVDAAADPRVDTTAALVF